MQRLEFMSKESAAPQRPGWVKDSMWRLCQHLEAILPVFSGICRSIRNNVAQWSAFKQSADVFNMLALQWRAESSGEGTLFY